MILNLNNDKLYVIWRIYFLVLIIYILNRLLINFMNIFKKLKNVCVYDVYIIVSVFFKLFFKLVLFYYLFWKERYCRYCIVDIYVIISRWIKKNNFFDNLKVLKELLIIFSKVGLSILLYWILIILCVYFCCEFYVKFFIVLCVIWF